MATVNKDFRIKNGLVVEGSTATVNGSNVLTEGSTEFLQDTTAAMFTGGTSTGITFSYNDTTGVIDATVSSTPTFADKIIFEGNTPDDYETTLQVTEPTQDNTLTLPNATDTLVGRATTDTLTNKTLTSPVVSGLSLSDSSIVFEGSSADDHETTLTVTNPTSDRTITLPDATGTVALTSDIPSLSGYVTETGTQTLTNKTLTSPIVDGNGVVFEGTTANDFETTLTVVDPTADRTITLPDATTTLVGTDTTQTLTNKTLTSPVVSGLSLTDSSIVFEGSTADEFETTLTVTDPTADRTITLPNVTGTVITTGDSGTVTNTMLAGSIANDKLTNSAITINGTSTSLGGTRTLVTDDIAEDGSPTNLWFTDERAQDAVAQAIANGTQTNITITYNDAANSLSFNASGAVSAVNGTTNQIAASTSSGTVTLSLPSAVTFPGSVTLNADPTQALQAATKQYVDSVAEGLHVHASVVAATTANIDLSTDLENGDTLDGVTLSTGDRVLVKNQNTASENGIYVVAASGAASRASDYNTAAEVDPGDFFFVTGGTNYDNTGWVQINTVTTLGTDPIAFVQFSGAGTYVAGNGLTLTGNSFSINTGVTADLSTAQTLTNKTLTSPIVSGLALSDSSIVFEGSTANEFETTLTVTDPTADRTITFPDRSGTVITSGDTGSVTSTMILDGTIVDADINASAAIADTKLGTISAADKVSLSALNIDGGTDIGAALVDDDLIIVDDGGNGTNRKAAVTRISDYVFGKVGGDITIASNGTASIAANSVALGTDTTGNYVATIAGTENQVTVTGSGSETAAVTLSLPQSIATTSTPTFGGLTLNGNLTLTDALIGTATQSLTDGNATVIDSWAAASYSSAKYIVQIKKGNDIQVLEVLVTVDANNNVYLTEYADVISNASIGTTDADYSGGSVRLLVTASNGTTVKVHKTLIEA